MVLGAWPVPAPGGVMSTPAAGSAVGGGNAAVDAGADAAGDGALEAGAAGACGADAADSAAVAGLSCSAAASAGGARATSVPTSIEVFADSTGVGAGLGVSGDGALGVGRAAGLGRVGGLGEAAAGAAAAGAAAAGGGGGGAAAMLRVLNTRPEGSAGLSQLSGTPLSTSQCSASTSAVMKKSARRGIYLRAGAVVMRCPRPGRPTAGPPQRAGARRWRHPIRGRRWRWSPGW